MNRPRLLGGYRIHTALLWVVMAGAIVVTVVLMLTELAHRREHAEDRMALRTQRLALDLVQAARVEGAAGPRLREILHRGPDARPELASWIVRDITPGAPPQLIHRKAGEADVPPGWLSHRAEVPVGERIWEISLAQPLEALVGDELNHQYILLSGLLALPLLGLVFWALRQQSLSAQANRSYDFLQTVIDSLPVPMFVKDHEHRYRLLNKAFARAFNVDPAELIGRDDRALHDEATARSRFEEDKLAVDSDEILVTNQTDRDAQGRERFWLKSKAGVMLPEGTRGVTGILAEITAQREAENRASATRDFMESVIDALPHSLVVKDEQGHYLMANRAWCDAVSIDATRVLGHTAADIFPPDIARQLEAQDAESWRTGQTVTTIQPRISLRGSKGWSLKSKRVVSLANGSRYNVQVTTDVTAHQEALQEAQRSRELLRGVLDSIPNPLIVKDASARYVLVNAAAESLGPNGGMRVGATDNDIFPPEICTRYAKEDEIALADLQTRWYSDYRIDSQGRERWWVKSKRAIPVVGEGRLIVSVLSDVTALKETERTLVRNQTRLRVLHDLSLVMLGKPSLDDLGQGACEALARTMENCTVTLARVDEAGSVVPSRSIGPGMKPRHAAWRVELGTLPALWHQLRHVEFLDSREMVGQASYAAWQAASGEAGSSGGKTLFVPMMLGARLAALLLIDAGSAEPWQSHELQLVTEAADHLRIACHAQMNEMARQSAEDALRVSESELRRHRDNLQMLVEERTRELTLALRSAEEAHQSKSQFFNNMSHELRTPMNAIVSFAKLGLEKVHDGTFTAVLAGNYLERIDRSAGRLLLLINDLLDLAKLEAGRMVYRFGTRDLRKLIEAVCDELSAMAAASAVTFNIESDVAETTAWCDELRIEQVMRNVLSNALRFAPRGSSIEISLRSSVLPAIEQEHVRPAREAIEITVCDQGPGIPPGEFDVIFDKYMQSSRARGGGTGLGLPIAREIVRQHGGSILAGNAASGGAMLIITLPIAGADSPQTAVRSVLPT